MALLHTFLTHTYCWHHSPTCDKEMCLQCGEDSHPHVATCEENMKQLIRQNEETGSNADDVKTLQWKMENSRQCPSCSIMINRDEGCNKVDCTLCGFSFCWECRSVWSEVCIYAQWIMAVWAYMRQILELQLFCLRERQKQTSQQEQSN